MTNEEIQKKETGENEEKGEDKKPQETPNKDEGDDGESIMEKAERLKKENQEILNGMTKEREKLEKLKSDRLLSGDSPAGQAKQEPKEETPSEYRKRIEQEVAAGKYD